MDLLEELSSKVVMLTDRVDELEEELTLAIEVIENSGVDYNEAVEHIREGV